MLKKIKTKSGFECEIDLEKFNEVETLELLVETEEGNTLKFAKLMMNLLGKDQYSKAKDFIRDDNGKTKTEKMYSLFTEIFLEIGDSGKKS